MSGRVRQTKNAKTIKVALSALLLSACTIFSAGCVLTDRFHHEPKPPGPPVGPVHQVVATWNNKVVVTTDVVNGGANLIGIAGRVYLFGPEMGFPVKGDGNISVGLYDATEPGKSRLVEVWKIDKETMARMFKKDRIGWGYTVFLPWKNYHPNIKIVEMVARYNPGKGYPLYAPKTKITLNRSDNFITPVSHQVPANDLAQKQKSKKQQSKKQTPSGPGYQKFRIPMPNGKPQMDQKYRSPMPQPNPPPIPPQSHLPRVGETPGGLQAGTKPITPRPLRAQMTGNPSSPAEQTGGIRTMPVSGTATQVVVPGSPKQVRKRLYGSFGNETEPQGKVESNSNATSQTGSKYGSITVFPRPVRSSIQSSQPSSIQPSTRFQAAPTAGGLVDPRAGNAVYPVRQGVSGE